MPSYQVVASTAAPASFSPGTTLWPHPVRTRNSIQLGVKRTQRLHAGEPGRGIRAGQLEHAGGELAGLQGAAVGRDLTAGEIDRLGLEPVVGGAVGAAAAHAS